MDQLDGPDGWTSWTDQLDGSAGRTSSLSLNPWPVRIFKDFPFSLYIVLASESDEGLVCHYVNCNLSGILDTQIPVFCSPGFSLSIPPGIVLWVLSRGRYQVECFWYDVIIIIVKTQCKQYLTLFWWNIGSWEHLEQMPTIMMTLVQATFVLVTFVHIKNISAIIGFWRHRNKPSSNLILLKCTI